MIQKHVLIVDDDPDLISFLADTMSASIEDCRISVARSGEEALERLEESPVDVLVTDLYMSGITGLALIRWVKAFHPSTRAILMTGDGRKVLAAEARSCGAWRTILKSLDLPNLIQEAVRNALSA